MKRYGCHNRAPYPLTVVVQERDDSRRQPEISYPHVMAKDCQFTLSELGRVDPRCDGCSWRKTNEK